MDSHGTGRPVRLDLEADERLALQALEACQRRVDHRRLDAPSDLRAALGHGRAVGRRVDDANLRRRGLREPLLRGRRRGQQQAGEDERAQSYSQRFTSKPTSQVRVAAG